MTWTFERVFAHAHSKKKPTYLTADQIKWHVSVEFLMYIYNNSSFCQPSTTSSQGWGGYNHSLIIIQ